MNRVITKLSLFLEAIKFEHSIFALPFAYAGLCLGVGGFPDAGLFWKVTLAMVSFRTFGMAVNRLFDARIDAHNPRTQFRALPAGKLSFKFVTGMAFLSLVIFEITCGWLSVLCLKLSIIPVALALLYPFAKRFTWMSHFILGIILGTAPYGAWIAARGDFSWIAGWLSLGIISWVASFDMIYALQDREFDQRFGLYSVPAFVGEKRTLDIASGLFILTISFWALAGWQARLGFVFWTALVLTSLLMGREIWLVRKFQMAKIQEAFFTMNAWVSLLLCGSIVLDLSLRR